MALALFVIGVFFAVSVVLVAIILVSTVRSAAINSGEQRACSLTKVACDDRECRVSYRYGSCDVVWTQAVQRSAYNGPLLSGSVICKSVNFADCRESVVVHDLAAEPWFCVVMIGLFLGGAGTFLQTAHKAFVIAWKGGADLHDQPRECLQAEEWQTKRQSMVNHP